MHLKKLHQVTKISKLNKIKIPSLTSVLIGMAFSLSAKGNFLWIEGLTNKHKSNALLRPPLV